MEVWEILVANVLLWYPAFFTLIQLWYERKYGYEPGLKPEEREKYAVKKFWTPKRLTRLSSLIALSGVFSFTKIPAGPAGSCGLDSVPCFYSGLVKKWNWKETFIVGWFARVLAAATVGFAPFGWWSHVGPFGVGLGTLASCFERYPRLKWGVLAGVIIGWIDNSFLLVFPRIFAFLWLLFGSSAVAFSVALTIVPGMVIAAGLAFGSATVAYKVSCKAWGLE